MTKLIFVYNADSGIFNFVADAAHKIFSPSTYPCNLCALTYTVTGLPRWRRYVRQLPFPVEFIHRDELREQYGLTDEPLPAAYLQDGEGLDLWIDADTLNACHSLDELIALVETKRVSEVAF